MNYKPIQPQISVKEFRQLLSEHKPNKIDPNLHRNLNRGWMLPYLLGTDSYVWGRWNYWAQMEQAQRLMDWDIPKIEFDNGGYSECADRSPTYKHLEECLDLIPKNQHWRSWSSDTYLMYFLDWLLFGFGTLEKEPTEPSGCEGASMRLY